MMGIRVGMNDSNASLSFQGGLDNIEIAKSYYSQAVKLNNHNLRALYGLFLVRM